MVAIVPSGGAGEAGPQGIAGSVAAMSYVAKTANYTLVATDDAIEANASGGAFTLTLPSAAATDVPGKLFYLGKSGTDVNAVTIATTGGQTINGSSLGRKLRTPNSQLVLISDGSNWWTVNPGKRSNAGILVAAVNGPDDARYEADFIADGTADDAELASSIATAQAHVVSSTYGAPRITLSSGQYRIANAVEFGSAPVVGLTSANVGTRMLWDGAADGTVFTKDFSLTGGYSFWEFANINFRNGTATPATWLDISDEEVDAMFHLHHLHFLASTGSMIKGRGWFNAFWNDLRFDGAGTYAMEFTPTSLQNLSVMALDRFTFDNNPSTTTKGVFLFDNTANASQLGLARISNGRIEFNVDLVAPAAVVHLKASNPANSRTLGLMLENITIDDVSGTASDYLVYMETAATTLSVPLVMINVRQSGLSAIFGGTLFSGHSVVPVQNSYGLVAINAGGSGGFSTITDSLLMAASASGGGTNTIYALKRGSETQNRWQISEQGVVSWGSGSATPDTNLYRSAADVLKTDDKFVATAGLGAGNSAAATTLGTVTKKMEVFDASGVSLGFVPIYDAIT